MDVITASGLPKSVMMIRSPLAAARTSSEKCALASLMPTDFMHAPPNRGQTEYDHTPEEESVTTWFLHGSSSGGSPPGHVTTFLNGADTDGDAATTSHFRPAQASNRAVE